MLLSDAPCTVTGAWIYPGAGLALAVNAMRHPHSPYARGAELAVPGVQLDPGQTAAGVDGNAAVRCLESADVQCQ